MESNWVDFKTIKRAVTIEQVLVRYGVKLRRAGKELRGPGLVNMSDPSRRRRGYVPRQHGEKRVPLLGS